jgi:SP family general alpha glucoside:H+ symporter-like MFS transporter
MAANTAGDEKHPPIDHAEEGEHGDITGNWKAVNESGRQAALVEHELTLKQAFKKYPGAIIWSVLVSTTVIMEGYDLVLIGSMFGQPAFQKKYGNYYPELDGYQISGPWQIALGNSGTIGAIFGAIANGYFVQIFGYRRVLIASLFFVTAFIFIIFFAQNIETLLVGEILIGLPWGVFATMAPAYASEVCPVALRGYLTIYVNLCWAFGQLISAGVNQGFSENSSEWAYRIPFAIQWVWPVPLAAIIFFAPESPWWLVQKERLEDAEKAIKRLASKSLTTHAAKQTVAMMMHTHEIERETSSGTSYWDCFKGVDLRRTEIVMLVFSAQIWSGLDLGGNPTYFFEQAGVPTSAAFKFSVGGLGLACIGTFLSWFLLAHMGRRTIFVWGLGVLAIVLLIVGILSAASASSASSYGQAGLILAWLFLYYTTVGPVTYAIISETSAIQLRNKSVCLSRIGYYLTGIVCATIQPYMMNPTEGNWKGKTCFFWAGTCSVAWLWSYFRLPETGGRTYEELDILFANKVPARKFAGAAVDAYGETNEARLTVN